MHRGETSRDGAQRGPGKLRVAGATSQKARGGLRSVPAGSASISLTWPGGVYGGGLSPAVVVTTNGPRHYVSSTPYNHYSLLTTIEQNWHLGYLGHAGDTAGGVLPMNDLLGP